MNNLKLGVLVCGVLGVIAVFLPMQTFGDKSVSFWSLKDLSGPSEVYMVMAGYVAAAVMGGLAAAKPPFLRWQAVVATVGNAFVLAKLHELIKPMLTQGAIGAKLMMIAAIAGLVLSILAIVKPETAK